MNVVIALPRRYFVNRVYEYIWVFLRSGTVPFNFFYNTQHTKMHSFLSLYFSYTGVIKASVCFSLDWKSIIFPGKHSTRRIYDRWCLQRIHTALNEGNCPSCIKAAGEPIHLPPPITVSHLRHRAVLSYHSARSYKWQSVLSHKIMKRFSLRPVKLRYTAPR